MDEPHSLATAVRRAATLERVELEVVLKYSLNLLEEPDFAAVDAALASFTQLESALVVADFWELEHPDCTFARLESGGTARGTAAAAAPSTSSASVLDL